MAKVLKICWGPWENASRDKRELSVYRDLGNEVLVLAEGDTQDKGRTDDVEGFPVKRYSAKPFGVHAPKRVNQISSLFTWAKYAKSLNPDVISGHDYIGWVIGWLSCLGNTQKPLFIYDAHEFELGRNIQRNIVRHTIIRKLEKFIINRSAFSIMVNDSIADEVQKIYKLKKRPIVVRSTPDYWEIDTAVCRQTRQELMGGTKEQKECADIPFVVMYHGGIMKNRGIETVIRLTAMNPNLRAIILGNGDEYYLELLKEMAAGLGVSDRVLFHPAVPIKKLWKYVGAADLSVMMIEGSSKSYYYALPNKFFESIQALTPIVASAFPEMKKLIEQYEIGLTCAPTDLEELNNCVERIRNDKELYMKYKRNLQNAKEELCWEKEKQILENAFRDCIMKEKQ